MPVSASVDMVLPLKTPCRGGRGGQPRRGQVPLLSSPEVPRCPGEALGCPSAIPMQSWPCSECGRWSSPHPGVVKRALPLTRVPPLAGGQQAPVCCSISTIHKRRVWAGGLTKERVSEGWGPEPRAGGPSKSKARVCALPILSWEAGGPRRVHRNPSMDSGCGGAWGGSTPASPSALPSITLVLSTQQGQNQTLKVGDGQEPAWVS